MAAVDIPKVFNMGAGEVVEVRYLEKLFGVTRRTAMKMLRNLRIEPLYIGNDAFFNLMAFKRIVFVLSRPGGPGFVFPGSRKKYDQRIYQPGARQITLVTDEIMAEAADPKILKEMAMSDSPGNMRMIQSFLKKEKPPQGETP